MTEQQYGRIADFGNVVLYRYEISFISKGRICMKKQKRRVLSLLLAVLVTLTMIPASFAADDLDGHWSKDAMEAWIDYDVIQGYTDGSVRPDKSITRGELAVMLDRIMSYQNKSYNDFSDLDDSWYTDAILGATAAGIIGGYTDGTVRPEATISRQEAVVMIARVLGLSVSNSAGSVFTDASDIGIWAQDAVNAMAAAGYIHGSNGQFRPTAGITRAEIVTILDNIFAGLCRSGGSYTDDVEGSLVVNSSDVSLEGMTIKGDLIIAEGVAANSVVLDGVTVEGRIIVRGGGTGSNAVVITGDSVVGTVVVQRQSETVEIEVQGNAQVNEIVASSGTESMTVSGTVDTVTVDDANTAVEIAGTVNTLSVTENAANADVTVAKGATVDSVTTVAENTTLNVSGTIKDVTVSENANNATVSTETGAKVESVTTSGAGTTVSGSGTVSKVEAAEGSTGTTVETGGTTIENNSSESVTTDKGSVDAGETGTTSGGTTSSGGSSSGGSSGGGSSQPSHTPSTLTTNIGQQTFYVGVPTEFTFTTTANDDKDKMVIGTSNFSNKEAIEKLEYYEVKDGQWYELTGDFGPAQGFPMSNATSRFRVTFKTAGNYTFTASMKLADGGTVLCSTNVNFTVNKTKPETMALVKNESELDTALTNSNITTIELGASFDVANEISVARAVTIDGNGYTIGVGTDTWSGTNGSKNLLCVRANDVIIKNLTMNSENLAYGLQGYTVTGMVLENVTVLNSKGTGLTVNGSSVTATGLTISGSAWGQSIDVSKGSGVENPATLTLDNVTGLKDIRGIVEDEAKTATITVGDANWLANGVLINDETNHKSYIKYVYAAGGVPTQWTVPATGSLQNDLIVPEDTTLTIPENVTLTVPADKTLTVIGTLIVNGNITGIVMDENSNELIYSAGQLRDLANRINNTTDYTRTVKLCADIDLSGENWDPIITTYGDNVTIDGQGFTISNMKVKVTSDNKGTYAAAGFIADNTASVTVSGLIFDEAYVSVSDGGDNQQTYAGVLLGHNDGTVGDISNITVKNATVVCHWQSGGIVGYSSKDLVFNRCTVEDTFIGGSNNTCGTLFGLGIINITARGCVSQNVQLYTDNAGDSLWDQAAVTNGHYQYGSIYEYDNKGKIFTDENNTVIDVAIVNEMPR